MNREQRLTAKSHDPKKRMSIQDKLVQQRLNYFETFPRVRKIEKARELS